MIVEVQDMGETMKWVGDVQAASMRLRQRQKNLDDMRKAEFNILPNIWTNMDGFALQEGLLILLRKAAEGIAKKAYRSLEFESEHECLKVVKEAAQTDCARLLCHYLTLVVEKRPPYLPSELRSVMSMILLLLACTDEVYV